MDIIVCGHDSRLSSGKRKVYKISKSAINEFAYLFSCQKPSRGTKEGRWKFVLGSANQYYAQSLIQNYIWKTGGLSQAIAKTKTEDPKKQNGSTYVKKYDWTKIKKANAYYNEHVAGTAITYPEIEKTTTSQYISGSDYIKIGKLSMNNYSLKYDVNCAYVNKKVNYNSVGAKGLLAGIYKVSVIINDGSNSVTCTYGKDGTYADTGMTFSYPNDRKKPNSYKKFPQPNEEFYIKINKNKLKNLNTDNLTIKVKVYGMSIKSTVMENTTKKYSALIKDNGTGGQPFLYTGAKMSRSTVCKAISFKKGKTNTYGVGLNVYISKVTSKNEDVKYDANIPYTYSNYRENENLFGNRSTWSEADKKAKPAVVEKGDKITFTFKVTNNSSTSVYIKQIEYWGCGENSENRKYVDLKKTISSGGSASTTKTIDTNFDSYCYLGAKVKKVYKTDKSTLIEGITSNSSYDYFSYKKYYVSIDKFITQKSGGSVNSVQKNNDNGGASIESGNTDENIEESEENTEGNIGEDTTSTGAKDSDESGEGEIGDDAIVDIIHLVPNDKSVKTAEGNVLYEYYDIADEDDKAPKCYFDKENNKYYIYDGNVAEDNNDSLEYEIIEEDTSEDTSEDNVERAMSDFTEVSSYIEASTCGQCTIEFKYNEYYTELANENNNDNNEDSDSILDNVYLKCDDNKNIIHDTEKNDSGFYAVQSTDDETVCYYHESMSKAINNTTAIYFILQNDNYYLVYVKKDEQGWYLSDSEIRDSNYKYEPRDGKTVLSREYLLSDGNGNLKYSNNEKTDIKVENETITCVPLKDLAGNIIYYYNIKNYAIYQKVEENEYQELGSINTLYYGGDSENGICYIETILSDEEEKEFNTNSDASTSNNDNNVTRENVREQAEDTAKYNAPVEAEDGDTITYTIKINNTRNINNDWGVENRNYSPFRVPKEVYVQVKDTLPKEAIEAETVSVSMNYYDSNGKKRESKTQSVNVQSNGIINFSDGNKENNTVKVLSGGYTEIQYTVKVNTKKVNFSGSKTKIETNTAAISNVYNYNDVNVNSINESPTNRKTSSDYFKITGIETSKTETVGNVYISKVEHSPTVNKNGQTNQYLSDEVPTTFVGKSNGVYAEYGDKITYGIHVTNYFEKDTPMSFDCYSEERSMADYATVTLRIELPDYIYTESKNGKNQYKLLINGVEYDIPTNEQKELMYTFTSRNVNISESRNRYLAYTDWCQTSCYSTHTYNRYRKEVYSTQMSLNDDTTKVEIVNIGNSNTISSDQLALKAYVTDIRYYHSYGYSYGYTGTSHLHSITTTTNEDGTTSTHFNYDTYSAHWCIRGSEQIRSWSARDDAADGDSGKIYAQNTGRVNSRGQAIWSGGTYIGEAYYKINDYELQLDEYIYDYNAEMAKYNNANGFTTGEAESIARSTYNKVDAEKYETLTFETRVTNKAFSNANYEQEANTSSGAKYKTRVRPSTVYQNIDSGLKFDKNNIRIVSSRYGDITGCYNISVNGNDITYTVNEYYSSTEHLYKTLLYPSDYIQFLVPVEVTESNMTLQDLKSSAIIGRLTNVNHHRRINRYDNEFKLEDIDRVYDRTVHDNVSSKQSDMAYVHVKDLVIAGTVWLDKDRNGYNNSETGKKDVTVKLYRSTSTLSGFNNIKTVKTNANGLYTFGRQPKANSTGRRYYYYVEFEYDGVLYKATEVYGGENDGYANGLNNLGNPTVWRQGKTGSTVNFPGTTAGKKEYLTDSNAYEFDDVRNNFDNNYQTIGYNKAYIGTNSTNSLSYTKSGHTSTLNESTDGNRIMTATSFIQQNYNNTINKSLNNIKKELLYDHYIGYSSPLPETEYLKYVNLGLVEREDVDLSLDADVYSVNTKINGEDMTYEFAQNTANSADPSYGQNGYANSYQLDNAYNLSLYQSDFNYRNDSYYSDESDLVNYKGNESELITQVTYKITMRNNSITNDEPNLADGLNDIPITAAVNEVAIYYDRNFMTPTSTFVTKNKYSDTGLFYNQTNNATTATYNGIRDSLVIDETTQYNNANKNMNNLTGAHSVLYLRSDNMSKDYIEEGGSRVIYITFTVDKDVDTRTLKTGDLEIIAEIGSYTTKYSANYKKKGLANQYAGLVDKDSNPGNVGIDGGTSQSSNYEDDTYKANIDINVPGLPNTPSTPDNPNNDPIERAITGTVWDDARSSTAGTESTGIQYLGNGIYNTGDTNIAGAQINPNDTGSTKDKPIANVKVSLIEVAQTADGKYYEYPAKDSNGNLIQTRTDANGKYTLKDYMPGYYKVKFTYGDDYNNAENVLYNGQDYKSTAYYNANYYNGEYSSDNIGASGNFAYFDDVKTALSEPSKSDAQDDEIRRLNVNSYSETMTTAQAKVFSETTTHTYALTKNTWMYADSTIFYAKPEEVESGDTSIDASKSNFNAIRIWNITDLDFGLEYRPESSIILDKNISTLELVTSDNKTLVKLYFKDDGTGSRVIDEDKSIGNENVQFLANNAKEQQGFVYVNMDNDILEGCTIKVEYEMDAENNSEVDRINKNLDDIKYEAGAINKEYQNKVYISNNYSANGTAAQLLANKYYSGYEFNASIGEETFKYLKELKKSYSSSGVTTTGTSDALIGTGYYGMYLGQTYYTGKLQPNNKDVVAQLKVDHILDYIDNDFTYSQSENSTENRLWQTTTSEELYDNKVLDFYKVKRDQDNNLIDKYGIRYDTENRSNLVLSVDSNKSGVPSISKGNTSLSRFLQTKNAIKDQKDTKEYTGTISAIATKILSAEDLTNGKGLSYENLAEVVQYTSLTGRRTTLPNGNNGGGVIANANVDNWNGYTKWEDDTDATEVITITPPTGLTE